MEPDQLATGYSRSWHFLLSGARLIIILTDTLNGFSNPKHMSAECSKISQVEGAVRRYIDIRGMHKQRYKSICCDVIGKNNLGMHFSY